MGREAVANGERKREHADTYTLLMTFIVWLSEIVN